MTHDISKSLLINRLRFNRSGRNGGPLAPRPGNIGLHYVDNDHPTQVEYGASARIKILIQEF